MVSLPLALGLLVFVAASGSPQVLADPDTYWHIAAGQWILTHGTIPTHDVFSFSMLGHPWTAHEWLSELGMAAAYRWAGFAGVTLLASACFALTAAWILRVLLDYLEPVPAIMLAAVTVVGVYSHFLARPHVLLWPLTAVWVSTLLRAAEARTAPPWWLLGVLLLWTNAHASFTMGLALAAGIALEACDVQRAHGQARRAVWQWGRFGAAMVLVVLINPNGAGALSHAVEVMRMRPVLARVSEWRSADFQTFQFILFWFGAVLTLAFTGRLRLSPARVLLLLGLIYLALKHQRYHALLALVSPFLLAAPLAAGLAPSPNPSMASLSGTATVSARLDRWMAQHARRSRWPGLVGVWLVAIGYAVSGRSWVVDTPSTQRTPGQAVDAAVHAGLHGPLLNSYDFGGYLIFRGIPVFIDGRADMYGTSFVVEALDAMALRAPHALEAELAQYRIAWTLLMPASPAVELLDHLPGWCRVYADAVAVVHQRCAVPAAVPAASVAPSAGNGVAHAGAQARPVSP